MIEHINCPQCGEKDSVRIITEETKNSKKLIVKKCTKCKYQSGIKEVLKLI